MGSANMENIIDKFTTLTEKPVKYLEVQKNIKKDIQNLVKSLYDFTKSQEQSGKSKTNQALSEIIVKDFDEEQIWQQIELQNSQCWDHLVWEVANCISTRNNLKFPVKIVEDEMEVLNNEEEKEEAISENISAIDNFEEKSKTKIKNHENKPNSKIKTSIVDDKFFKLQDMEKFLINEEKMEEKGKKDTEDDEGSIDMFEDIDSEGTEDEGGKEMMYSDFFNDDNGEEYDKSNENGDFNEDDEATVNDKKVRFAEPESDEGSQSDDEDTHIDKKGRFAQPDSDDTDSDDSTEEISNKQINEEDKEKDEKKSEFELRQQRLKQQISKLEEKTLTEAPWQLKGEIDASKRPQNSLLEEVLDFDLTTRPPPTITEQTTVTLEGLIIQRIKDKAWDDVVRKEKPVDDQLLFKKPEVLDHSKSKLSLAQVYETEYLKQKQAQSGDVEEEKEPESHTEIRNAMSKLFAQLDALCHYHYTPKPPQAEVKIVSNTPAISMEEVAPVATSDAALLAPEEVKRKHKGELMSKEERTQTDKNRERRKKKILQRKKGHPTDVTNHRNTTKGPESNDKTLKTSKAFFQQLNDDSNSLIKSKKKNVKNK
ncbi:unnamed protein product, partial [Brenthis ino]